VTVGMREGKKAESLRHVVVAPLSALLTNLQQLRRAIAPLLPKLFLCKVVSAIMTAIVTTIAITIATAQGTSLVKLRGDRITGSTVKKSSGNDEAIARRSGSAWGSTTITTTTCMPFWPPNLRDEAGDDPCSRHVMFTRCQTKSHRQAGSSDWERI